MATYRCLSCGALYVDPQRDGTRSFHACGEQVIDRAKGTRAPYPNPRDENIVQETPGGPVAIKAAGAGRERLADDDILTGVAPEDLPALRARPAIGLSPLPEETPPAHLGKVMPERTG